MAKRKSSTGAKTAAKKPAARSKTAAGRAAKADGSAALSRARRQTAAVLLFALAILLFCMVLIPGASLWGACHRLLLGLFGVCAYVAPILLLAASIIIAMEKAGSVSSKLWQSLLLSVLLSSVLHIFAFDVNGNYFAGIAAG